MAKATKVQSKSKSTKAAPKREDVYKVITDKIVAQLEQGVRPWAKPWTVTGNAQVKAFPNFALPRRFNGEAYRGMNILLLWLAMDANGWTQPTFMTYRQAQELGGHVRKGEKSKAMVVYAGAIEKAVEPKDGGDDEVTFRKIPFLRTSAVFNVEQIEGLPEKFFTEVAAPIIPEIVETPKGERNKVADDFFLRVGVVYNHGGHRAYYSTVSDKVQMPEFDAFVDANAYYATLGHETVHWTGHHNRLDRKFGQRFGDDAYAFEELVAEMGAAFLCADLGLHAEPRGDHASYLQSWLKVLKNDKRAIFTAASAAQKAADFIHEQAKANVVVEIKPKRVRKTKAKVESVQEMAA